MLQGQIQYFIISLTTVFGYLAINYYVLYMRRKWIQMCLLKMLSVPRFIFGSYFCPSSIVFYLYVKQNAYYYAIFFQGFVKSEYNMLNNMQSYYGGSSTKKTVNNRCGICINIVHWIYFHRTYTLFFAYCLSGILYIYVCHLWEIPSFIGKF